MSTRDADLLARFAWSRIVEPGDRAAAVLIDVFGAAEALHRFVTVDKKIKEQIVDASGAPLAEKWLARHDMSQAQRELEQALAAGLTALLPGDELWPARLGDQESADPLAPAQPLMLWARGDVALLQKPSLAITGARACTGYGEHVTREIADHAAQRSVTVLAGASYGVDGAAHRAALAAGGKTVAVLVSGVDRAYPAGHRDLIERIAEQGLVVSEIPPGTAPTRHRFQMRGRVIAALADAMVVPEAGARSGALQVAQQAHGIGRPVGAVPGPVTSAASAGCHMLVQQGIAQLITGSVDALALLNGQTPQIITKEA